MQIDEEIHLEEYNPGWVQQYEEEKLKLLKTLGDAVVQIEHFGSTSILGMTAKPIVDILIGVNQLPVDNYISDKLTALKYEDFGEISPGRLYLRKRGEKSFNLAIIKFGSKIWVNNIVLRDYLRIHQEESRQYRDVKLKAYSGGYRTLLQYSNSKGPFISDLLQKARKWASVES